MKIKQSKKSPPNVGVRWRISKDYWQKPREGTSKNRTILQKSVKKEIKVLSTEEEGDHQVLSTKEVLSTEEGQEVLSTEEGEGHQVLNTEKGQEVLSTEVEVLVRNEGGEVQVLRRRRLHQEVGAGKVKHTRLAVDHDEP